MSGSDEVTILAKWAGQSATMQVARSSTVEQLADICKAHFGLETVKIIGLVKGKLPASDTQLSSLHPPGATVKLSLIGVARSTLASMGEQESQYEVARLAEEARLAAEARERAAWEAAAMERRQAAQAAEAIAAREREEARRVHAAEWEARRREEDAARMERELAAEQDVQSVMSIELQAFHSPQLDASGKILLPPQALQAIIDKKLLFPLTFQITRPENVAVVAAESESAVAAAASSSAAAASPAVAAAAADASTAAAASSSAEMKDDISGLSLASEATAALSPRRPSQAASASASASAGVPIVSPLVAYFGVQDFTAPQSTVSVPQSLLRALNVSDGAKLHLTNVNLQRASHVVLQSLSRAWGRLPDMERRALLEFQLRKHTFLARDSVISFSYHPHLPTFRFRVVETRPAPVVSITDTELATEILPFDDAAMDESGPASAATASSASSSSASSAAAAAASGSASDSGAKEAAKLTADEAVTGRMSRDGVVRFEYDVSDPNAAVEIEVKSLAGDVDLYVLSSADAEAQSGVEAGVSWHTWAVQTRAPSKLLTLSAADPLFHTGTWQLALRAYGADAQFSITVRERSSGERPAVGHQLGSSASSSSSSSAASSSAASATPSAAAPPADSTICPTCRAHISARALSLHSVQCARLNWICPQCDVVMKSSERDKHTALAHSTYSCLCGVQLQQAAMVAHRRDACSLRLVSCQYCPLRLVIAERGAHQHECGTLRSHCSLCADSIQRKMMRRHLVKAHGGINGKTDERDIGWADFWA